MAPQAVQNGTGSSCIRSAFPLAFQAETGCLPAGEAVGCVFPALSLFPAPGRYGRNLQNAATTRVFHNTLHINKLEHQLQMRHPAHRNRERTQLLASLQAGLSHAAASRMTDLSSQLTLIQARLEAHSPEQTLRRGYALVENQDKQLIRQTNQVHAGKN